MVFFSFSLRSTVHQLLRIGSSYSTLLDTFPSIVIQRRAASSEMQWESIRCTIFFLKKKNHRDAFRFINTICRIEANLEMKKQTNKQTIVPSRTGSERRRRRGRRKRKKRRGIRRRLLGVSNVYLRLERGSRVRRGCMGMREKENSQARV